MNFWEDVADMTVLLSQDDKWQCEQALSKLEAVLLYKYVSSSKFRDKRFSEGIPNRKDDVSYRPFYKVLSESIMIPRETR